MRKLWMVPLALLLVAFAATLVLLSTPGLLTRALQWGTASFTDYRLEIEGLVFEPSQLQLEFDTLQLLPKGSTGPALLTVLGFAGDTRLADLRRGNLEATTLKSESVVVYVSAEDDSEDPTPAQWMQYLRFLPASLVVDSVHVVNRDGDVAIFPLRDLRGARSAADRFEVSLLADLDGAPLDVSLEITAREIMSDQGRVTFSARLAAPESGTRGTLEGLLTGYGDAFRFDVAVDAAFAEVATFFDLFPDAPPLAGALTLQGKLQGDLNSFTLTDAAFELDNRPAYFFEASGAMTSQDSPDPNLSLIASGELDSARYFLRWLDLDLSPLGGIRASIALSGTVANPAIEQLTVVTASSDGLWIALNGSSGPGSLGSPQLPPGTLFTVHAVAPSLALLSPWLGQAPTIDPGPWEFAATLRENDGALHVENIMGQLGHSESTQLRVTGNVAQVALTPPEQGTRVAGIDLALEVSSVDLVTPGRWFNTDVPPGFSFQSQVQVSGTDAELTLHDGTAQITHEHLTIDVNNLNTVLGHNVGYEPQALQAGILVQAPEVAALGQFAALDLPPLGAGTLEGLLKYGGERVALDGIRATLDSLVGQLLVTGALRDLTGAREAELNARVQHLSLDALLTQFAPGTKPPAELGGVSGRFTLRGTQADYVLSDLELSSTEGAALGLRASGNGRYANDGWSGAVSLNYGSDDRELLKALSGLSLKPVTGQANLTVDATSAQLQAKAQLGDTALSLAGKATHTGGTIDGLQATLSSALVNLDDIGLQASGTETTDYRPTGQLDTDPDNRSLPQFLTSLPRYPIDLRLQLDTLRGEVTRFDDINVHVNGSGTTYLLDQFDFSYDAAPAEIRGVVDISLDPPGLSIAGQAQSIPLNTLSRDLGIDTDISGSLNLRGGLSAQGATGTELLQQLNGNMAFALENATVEGAAYDVLATGILTWLFSGAALEKSTFLDCTMAQFTLENGVARTDSLFVESPNMIATGIGSFDLPKRTLAFTLTPRSKSRSIQIPSSISLRGDMASPRTSVSPIAATLDVSAEAMLFVPRLLVKVFGGGQSKSAATRPCEVLLTQ